MNSKTASFVLFACILGFCLVVSHPLSAQVVGATLSGTVTDASGGVIPNAQITATNTATGHRGRPLAGNRGKAVVDAGVDTPQAMIKTARPAASPIRPDLRSGTRYVVTLPGLAILRVRVPRTRSGRSERP